MKTTRWFLGAALFGTALSLGGCGGGGTYQIPTVEPVVMQKPDDELLENLEGNDKPADAAPSTSSTAAKPDASNEPLPETPSDADATKTDAKTKSKSKK